MWFFFKKLYFGPTLAARLVSKHIFFQRAPSYTNIFLKIKYFLYIQPGPILHDLSRETVHFYLRKVKFWICGGSRLNCATWGFPLTSPIHNRCSSLNIKYWEIIYAPPTQKSSLCPNFSRKLSEHFYFLVFPPAHLEAWMIKSELPGSILKLL